jgi:predicted HicB family RNase H-like nuclease
MEGEGSRAAVVLSGQVQVYHRPHPSPDTDKGAVASIRNWREANGVNPWTFSPSQAIAPSSSYAEDVDMLRGEFIGLNGGADFYARDIATLKTEGAKSLQVFLDTCNEPGINPYRHFSGKSNARINLELHALAVEKAAAEGISLNQFIERAIEHEAAA